MHSPAFPGADYSQKEMVRLYAHGSSPYTAPLCQMLSSLHKALAVAWRTGAHTLMGCCVMEVSILTRAAHGWHLLWSCCSQQMFPQQSPASWACGALQAAQNSVLHMFVTAEFYPELLQGSQSCHCAWQDYGADPPAQGKQEGNLW